MDQTDDEAIRNRSIVRSREAKSDLETDCEYKWQSGDHHH